MANTRPRAHELETGRSLAPFDRSSSEHIIAMNREYFYNNMVYELWEEGTFF